MIKKLEKIKGISLIVLIITIIVIIILAGAVILSLNNTNVINNANKAVEFNNRANVIDAYNLLAMDAMLYNETKNGEAVSLDIPTLENRLGMEKDSLKNKYQIVDGKLQENTGTVEVPKWEDIANVPSTPVDSRFTKVKSKSAYNKPYLPEGFEVVSPEGVTHEQGLVMMNTEDKNEFVWIPVQEGEYKKTDFQISSSLTPTECSEDSLTIAQSEADANVVKNGGFYIGRYEAGVESKRIASGDTPPEKPLIQKDKFPFNYVNYNDAKEQATNLYASNSDCVSVLTTGKQWDTALMFLGEVYAKDSTGKGNYYDSDSTNNPGKTGAKEEYAVKNVYDMAGNTYEWINEIYSSYRVRRGGNYLVSGSEFPAGFSYYNSPTAASSSVSFRVSLYIK